MTWIRLPPTPGNTPQSRGGHSANLIGNKVLVFGGQCPKEGGSYQYLNDVVVLDLETLTWIKPRVDGRFPSERYGHTATLVEDKLFIFGGRSKGGICGTYLNDVYYLNIGNITWYNAAVEIAGKLPPPRMNHTSTLVEGRLFMFGGWNGKQALNDLHVFDCENFAWNLAKTTGDQPSPRYGHSANLVDNQLIIIGGTDGGASGTIQYFNDVYSLNVDTLHWTRVRCVGPKVFPGRYGHSACALGSDILIVGGWGGVPRCILCGATDVGEQKGKHHQDCIIGKSIARSRGMGDGSGVDVLNDGRSVKETINFKDMYYLDTTTMAWNRVTTVAGNMPAINTGFTRGQTTSVDNAQPTITDAEGGGPITGTLWTGAIYSHSTTVVDHRLVTFGGCDGVRPLQDVHILDTSTLIRVE